MMTYQRYHVYRACLDPTVGAEMKKSRPVVVISPAAMNKHLKTVVVCPVTSSLHPTWKTRVECKWGEVAVDQVRCLDKQRLVEDLGGLNSEQIEQLQSVIRDLYVS